MPWSRRSLLEILFFVRLATGCADEETPYRPGPPIRETGATVVSSGALALGGTYDVTIVARERRRVCVEGTQPGAASCKNPTTCAREGDREEPLVFVYEQPPRCADGACEVDVDPSNPSRVHVRGVRAGATTLTWSLRAVDRPEERLEGQAEVSFAAPASVVVRRTLDEAPGSEHDVFVPGARARWCGVVVDRANEALFADGMDVRAEGDVALEDVSGACAVVVARAPGRGTVRFAWKHLAKEVPVETVREDEVRSVEIVALPHEPSSATHPLGDDALADAAPVTAVTACEGDLAGSRNVVVARVTTDRGKGYAPGSVFRVPTDVLEDDPHADEGFAALHLAPSRDRTASSPDRGELVAQIGAARATATVTIARCD